MLPDAATVPLAIANDGTSIPRLGFGVWQMSDELAETATTEALRRGFRHIDTAAAYENEAGVGRGVRASGVDRGEVFVVTKLRNFEQGYDTTIRACQDSVERLGLGPIDLYLIHWPVPTFGTFVESWRALVTLRDRGLVRSIGVSNFTEQHLADAADATGVVPAVNQVELHPYLQQEPLRAHCAAAGILTEAWSPLGQGAGLLDDPTLTTIARSHGASVAQVALAWQLAIGNVVLTRSARPERVSENLAAAALTLEADELEAIGALDQGLRYGKDPVTSTHSQRPGT